MNVVLTKSRLVGLFLLLVSVLVNGLQGRRILRLEAALEGRVSTLAEGSSLPPLDLTDMSGKPVRVDYRSAHGTLIYVFSYSCVWCKHNRASFRALSHAVQSVRILCLSLSPLETGASSEDIGVDFPAYAPSGATVANYRLGATPTTIFVSAEGKVLRQWSGAYTGTTKSAIEDYFKVRLPEI